MITWEDAHRRAAVLAAQVHSDLSIDLRRPVDVFAAVQQLGVILGFAPLAGVSGLYLPKKIKTSSAGVLLHSGHPRTRQRYTAGHELGHHVFGHGVEIDGDLEEALQRADVERWPDHEKEAEAFGAWFLMPRRLIRHGLRSLQIETPRNPVDVYALSLWLGTSYTATARQLATTRIVDGSTAAEWARIKPRNIKLALAGALAPDNLKNDVWWLDASSHQHPISARFGDRLVITLTEIPSSGYSWRWIHLPDGFSVLADSNDDAWEPELPPRWREDIPTLDETVAGGSHPRAFVVGIDAAVGPEIYHVALVKDRPWRAAEPVDSFEVLVSVVPRLHGIQLTEEELRLHA